MQNAILTEASTASLRNRDFGGGGDLVFFLLTKRMTIEVWLPGQW